MSRITLTREESALIGLLVTILGNCAQICGVAFNISVSKTSLRSTFCRSDARSFLGSGFSISFYRRSKWVLASFGSLHLLSTRCLRLAQSLFWSGIRVAIVTEGASGVDDARILLLCEQFLHLICRSGTLSSSYWSINSICQPLRQLWA